jgi:hypothetical protein
MVRRTAERRRFTEGRQQYLRLGNIEHQCGIAVLDEIILTTLPTKLLPSERREKRLNVSNFALVGDGT